MLFGLEELEVQARLEQDHSFHLLASSTSVRVCTLCPDEDSVLGWKNSMILSLFESLSPMKTHLMAGGAGASFGIVDESYRQFREELK
jgi:hypothetical protein